MPSSCRQRPARPTSKDRRCWAGTIARDTSIETIENFRRAIGLKPDYPAAFAGLGLAYWRKYREQRDAMHLQHASENAARAVELDPQLTLALVSLAFAKIENGDLDAAEKLVNDALSRDPGNADAFAARATCGCDRNRSPKRSTRSVRPCGPAATTGACR